MPSNLSKQSEALKHIQLLLSQRGIHLEPGVFLVDEIEMRGFEYKEKYLAVDLNSGLWIGGVNSKWQCLSSTCTVSSAAEAVEFLMEDGG
jgi:hypothetical protein